MFFEFEPRTSFSEEGLTCQINVSLDWRPYYPHSVSVTLQHSGSVELITGATINMISVPNEAVI